MDLRFAVAVKLILYWWRVNTSHKNFIVRRNKSLKTFWWYQNRKRLLSAQQEWDSQKGVCDWKTRRRRHIQIVAPGFQVGPALNVKCVQSTETCVSSEMILTRHVVWPVCFEWAYFKTDSELTLSWVELSRDHYSSIDRTAGPVSMDNFSSVSVRFSRNVVSYVRICGGTQLQFFAWIPDIARVYSRSIHGYSICVCVCGYGYAWHQLNLQCEFVQLPPGLIHTDPGPESGCSQRLTLGLDVRAIPCANGTLNTDRGLCAKPCRIRLRYVSFSLLLIHRFGFFDWEAKPKLFRFCPKSLG